MKRIILALAVMTVALSRATAQETGFDFRERFMFGIKTGINYSTVYNGEGEAFNAEPKIGLALGITATIPIGRYFGIHPELLISQRGFKATGKVLGENYDFRRTSTFLDVPLLFAVKPIGGFTFLLGPQFAYLINQKDEFTNATTSIATQQAFKNDNIRKNILCFVIGGDINIKHIVLGARAGWDFQTNKGDGTSYTPRYKNAWLQATIGYRLYN